MDSIYEGFGREDLLKQANDWPESHEKYKIIGELQKAPTPNFDIDTFTTENELDLDKFEAKTLSAVKVSPSTETKSFASSVGSAVSSLLFGKQANAGVNWVSPLAKSLKKKSIGKKGKTVADVLKGGFKDVKNTEIKETRIEEILESIAEKGDGKIYPKDIERVQEYLNSSRFDRIDMRDTIGTTSGGLPHDDYDSYWSKGTSTQRDARFEYVMSSPRTKIFDATSGHYSPDLDENTALNYNWQIRGAFHSDYWPNTDVKKFDDYWPDPKGERLVVTEIQNDIAIDILKDKKVFKGTKELVKARKEGKVKEYLEEGNFVALYKKLSEDRKSWWVRDKAKEMMNRYGMKDPEKSYFSNTPKGVRKVLTDANDNNLILMFSQTKGEELSKLKVNSVKSFLNSDRITYDFNILGSESGATKKVLNFRLNKKEWDSIDLSDNFLLKPEDFDGSIGNFSENQVDRLDIITKFAPKSVIKDYVKKLKKLYPDLEYLPEHNNGQSGLRKFIESNSSLKEQLKIFKSYKKPPTHLDFSEPKLFKLLAEELEKFGDERFLNFLHHRMMYFSDKVKVDILKLPRVMESKKLNHVKKLAMMDIIYSGEKDVYKHAIKSDLFTSGDKKYDLSENMEILQTFGDNFNLEDLNEFYSKLRLYSPKESKVFLENSINLDKKYIEELFDSGKPLLKHEYDLVTKLDSKRRMQALKDVEKKGSKSKFYGAFEILAREAFTGRGKKGELKHIFKILETKDTDNTLDDINNILGGIIRFGDEKALTELKAIKSLKDFDFLSERTGIKLLRNPKSGKHALNALKSIKSVDSIDDIESFIQYVANNETTQPLLIDALISKKSNIPIIKQLVEKTDLHKELEESILKLSSEEQILRLITSFDKTTNGETAYRISKALDSFNEENQVKYHKFYEGSKFKESLKPEERYLIESSLNEGFYKVRKLRGQNLDVPGGLFNEKPDLRTSKVSMFKDRDFADIPPKNVISEFDVPDIHTWKNSVFQMLDLAIEKNKKTLDIVIEPDLAYGENLSRGSTDNVTDLNTGITGARLDTKLSEAIDDFGADSQQAIDIQKVMNDANYVTTVQYKYHQGKKTIDGLLSPNGVLGKQGVTGTYNKGVYSIVVPLSLSLPTFAGEALDKTETPYNKQQLEEVYEALQNGQFSGIEEVRDELTGMFDKDIANNFILDMVKPAVENSRAEGYTDDEIALDLQKSGFLPKVPLTNPGILLKQLSSNEDIGAQSQIPNTYTLFGKEVELPNHDEDNRVDPNTLDVFRLGPGELTDKLARVTMEDLDGITEERLGSMLMALYMNERDDDSYTPAPASILYNMGKGFLLKDDEAFDKAAVLVRYQSMLVATTLNKKGLDVTLEEDGLLYITKDGKKEQLDYDLFESLKWGIWDSKREIVGAIAGFTKGYTSVKAPYLPAKFAAGVVGGYLGSGAGRVSDFISLSLKTNEQVEASQLMSEFKDAGNLDLIFSIIGGSAIQFVKRTHKLLKPAQLRKAKELAIESPELAKEYLTKLKTNLSKEKIDELVPALIKVTHRKVQQYMGKATGFDRLVRGNPRGAFKSLKLILNKTDEDLIKAVEEFEELNGRKLLTYSARKFRKIKNVKDIRTILRVIQETQPNFEKRISTAMASSKGEGATLSDKIAKRSQNLFKLIEGGSNKRTTLNLREALKNYEKNVKVSRADLKEEARNLLTLDAQIDLNGLKLTKFLEKTKLHKQNPRILEEIDNYIAFVKSDIKSSTEPQQKFQALLEFRKIITSMQSKLSGTSQPEILALANKLKEVDQMIHNTAKNYMGPEGSTWLKNFNSSNREYHKLYKLQETALYEAFAKGNPKDAKSLVKSVLNSASSVDKEQLMRVLGKLNPKLRGEIENEIVLFVTQKNSVSFNDGYVIDFPGLSSALEEVSLTQSGPKDLKRVINQMAKIYRNDPHVARALGRNPSESGARFFATSAITAGKQHLLSEVLNYVLAVIPGKSGRKRALIVQLAKVMDNPLNSKSSKELLSIVENNPEITSAFHKLIDSFAKYGKRENYATQKIFRTTGSSNGLAKTYHTNRKTIADINKIFNDSAVKKSEKLTIESMDVSPTLIATPQEATILLGRPVKSEDLRNKVLINDLKKQGFLGLALEEIVIIFK